MFILHAYAWKYFKYLSKSHIIFIYVPLIVFC